MIKCPHCSSDINQADYSKDLTFCPYCGGDLSVPVQSGPPLSFCPYCGGEITPGMKFCPGCGKEIPVPRHREETLSETVPQQHQKGVILGGASKAVKSVFSADRKSKKLYQQWVDNAGLSPDDIPSFDDEGIVTTEPPSQNSIEIAGIPLRNIILGASFIFIIISIIIIL